MRLAQSACRTDPTLRENQCRYRCAARFQSPVYTMISTSGNVTVAPGAMLNGGK